MNEILIDLGNRYKVLGTLGQGGMGTVYRVTDTTNGQDVALKVLTARQPMDERAFLQFKQEFRVMARLRHPHTCQVYDYGLLPDGSPFFTMELVPGRGLDELITLSGTQPSHCSAAGVPQGGLDPREFPTIMRQLCLALGYIHQQGFVHCDIKLENIRLMNDGGDVGAAAAVKLMDFGLMEVAGQALEAIKGTLTTIAPEVAKLDRLDQRSDIYSLGVVAYQLLTGVPPFRGNSAIELLRAHLHQAPRPLREFDPTIPAALESMVLKMLAKEPSARYQSTFEVLAALGNAYGWEEQDVEEGLGGSLLASGLIGRNTELERLAVALVELQLLRRSTTLGIVGPAGCGKSRLLGEFRFKVQLEELPFLQGTCSEQRTPYGPFLEVLRGLLPLAKARCPDDIAEYAPLLSKLLPELADGRPAPVLEPEQEKILLQAAITALILKSTAPDGGVLVLEDWGLVDPLSADALTYLIRNAADAPLLLVLTSRDERALRDQPGLAGTLDPAHLLSPSFLDLKESTDMVTGMLGVDGMPTGLAIQFQELTHGNPQLIGNLLEHLLRTGVLGKSKGRWRLPEALTASDIPDDLSALLLERLCSLSPAAQRVAEFAAVYGAPLALDDAKALLVAPPTATAADEPRASYTEEDLFDSLDELLQARVLDVGAGQSAHGEVGGGLYRFASTSLRHTLYERIPLEARLNWHTRVALHLEQRVPVNANAVRGDGEVTLADLTALAQHHLHGHATASAIQFGLLAGQRNLDVLAYDAAITLLKATLIILDAQPNLAPWVANRCDLLNELATAYHWKHELAPATAYLNEALPLLEQLDDKQRLLEGLVTYGKNCSLVAGPGKTREAITTLERAIVLADELGNARTGVRARINLGRNLFFMGSHSRAREVFEQAVALAKGADLPIWTASGLSFLGYLQVLSGPTMRDIGFANMAEAIATQERIGDKGGVGYSYNLLFELQLQAGKLPEAETSALRNAEIARELGITDDYTIALLNHAIVCVEMGEFERALESGERCLQQAIAHNHQVALPISKAVVALAKLYRGHLGEASAQIQAAETQARETNNYVYSIVIPYVIDCHLHMGQLQDALNAAQESQFILRSLENTEGQIKLWGHLSEIHGAMGQYDMARDFNTRCIDAAVDVDAKGVMCRALRTKAWLAKQEGDLEEAHKAAEQALSVSTKLGSKLHSAQVTALLGEICLAKADPDTLQHFLALQALADQMGSPRFRALALFGQAAANPGSDQASAMLLESQKLLKSIVADASEDQRRIFLAIPEHQRILDRIPGIAESVGASPEASQLTLDRLQRVSQELQGVASQYGLLFKEWTTKSNQLEMLNNLAKKINETLVVDAVLVQVVQLTLEITKAERGFLFLVDEDANGQLTCKSAFNQFGRAISHEQASMSVCSKVASTGLAIAIMDAMADTEFQASKSIAALNLRTLMCVPLQAKGKNLGVLYVDSQAVVTTFTEKDLELLKAIASHASVAIENAKLYTALNRRAAELERALELYRKADYEASTDMLTGLRNRRFFQDQASRELDISRRYTRSMSLIMIDVDHFKKFNDTYGHATGDEVLKAMGAVLTQSVRTCDLPARLGGEEFVVLCPDTDGAGAALVAERIRKMVSEVRLNDVEGNPVRQITASLGVACLRAGDTDLSMVLERADAALYASKNSGRNQVQICAEPTDHPTETARPIEAEVPPGS